MTALTVAWAGCTLASQTQPVQSACNVLRGAQSSTQLVTPELKVATGCRGAPCYNAGTLLVQAASDMQERRSSRG